MCVWITILHFLAFDRKKKKNGRGAGGGGGAGGGRIMGNDSRFDSNTLYVCMNIE